MIKNFDLNTELSPAYDYKKEEKDEIIITRCIEKYEGKIIL